MRKILSLFTLTISLCLIIASCDDKHNGYPETPEPVPEEPGTNEPDIDEPVEQTAFWEHTHLAFMGLKGAVNTITERSRSHTGNITEESVIFFEARFNEDGMFTYYNSTGVEMQPATRGNVWVSPSYYVYKYNDSGRISKVIVNTIGEVPVEYTLTYGEHTNYVPLIFPVGPMEYFLVKGLESITSSDRTVQYIFDGTEASYTSETWMGQVKTVFRYGLENVYPIQKIATTTIEGVLQATETTRYTYDERGGLVSTDYKAEDGEGQVTERTITRYHEKTLLLLKSKVTDAYGTTMDWSYTYNVDNLPLKFDFVMGKGSEDEVNDEEHYEYLTFDKQENWIDSKQKQSSFISEMHQDQEVYVCREISYYIDILPSLKK